MGISFQSVSLAYGIGNGSTVDVFCAQDLEIEDGQFIGVVGESGCGKTSLLRLAAGLVMPTDGRVRIGGESPAQALKARKIAMLFQRPVLLPWRTVIENVRLPGKLWRDPVVLNRANHTVRAVGLEEFAHAYPSQLSGGMQARAAIARALVQDPEIMLMDEPFAALDELTRTKMNFELLRIWSKVKQSVIFVTHSVEECVLLSDRLLLMGPRPNGILEDIRIDIPRPRSPATLESQEYMRMVGHVRHRLQAASGLNGRGSS